MIIRVIAALLFISVPIIGKVEFNTENDLLEQCKMFVEMIYTDKRVLTEVLYRYIYAVAF